ncbi:hypothetical protein AB205_0140020, partial [Aquarana catesbeiana]
SLPVLLIGSEEAHKHLASGSYTVGATVQGTQYTNCKYFKSLPVLLRGSEEAHNTCLQVAIRCNCAGYTVHYLEILQEPACAINRIRRSTQALGF